jgi:hypothetical protein
VANCAGGGKGGECAGIPGDWYRNEEWEGKGGAWPAGRAARARRGPGGAGKGMLGRAQHMTLCWIERGDEDRVRLHGCTSPVALPLFRNNDFGS